MRVGKFVRHVNCVLLRNETRHNPKITSKPSKPAHGSTTAVSASLASSLSPSKSAAAVAATGSSVSASATTPDDICSGCVWGVP